MPVSAPTLPAPSKSEVYRWARRIAHKQDHAREFRLFCALLEAPSDLRCLLLVAGNLRRAIEVIPPTWDLIEDFNDLKRAAIWMEENSDILQNRIVPTNDKSREPMYPYVSTYPL